MKNLLIAGFLLLAFSFNALSMWALVPLNEIVKESDLIIIGTLQKVSEYSEDNIDYGEGTIVIEKVVSGNVKNTDGLPLKPGDALQLKWQNSSFIACPRVEHKWNENKKGVWLLTIDNEKFVSADYPGRFESLDKLSEIKRYLKRLKTPEISKIVGLQNTNEQNYRTQASKPQKEIAIFTETAETTNQYSPMSAFLVFIAALIFFRVLYRDRFGW